MGKAVAVTVTLLVVCVIACIIVAATVKGVYRVLWYRAKRRAKWEPYAEMTGTQEASVTVRRIARLFSRREVLNEFEPVHVTVDGLADPRLFEAYVKAEEQAQINNVVRLGEDI